MKLTAFTNLNLRVMYMKFFLAIEAFNQYVIALD